MSDEQEQEFKPWKYWGDVPVEVQAQLMYGPFQKPCQLASGDSFYDALKKIAAALCIVLAFFLQAHAQSTTTVTGSLKDLGIGVVSSGTYVEFELQGCAGNPPRVNGTALIAPTFGNRYMKRFPADSNGNISGTLYSTRDATGNGAGAIECGGSFTSVWYNMTAYVNGKAGATIPVHAKASATLNISNVTPITTNPVVTAPTGDSTYARLDGGNQNFTGAIGAPSAAITGALTAGSFFCKNFENVRCVDSTNSAGWAGTDVGGWVNSAIANLPATGGKVVIADGAYSFSTSIQLSKSNVLICGSSWNTVLTWTGGAGTFAIILGDGTVGGGLNSTVAKMGVFSLQLIGSAGGTGIKVRRGVAVGTYVELNHLSGFDTAISWGETGGSAFDGVIRDNEIDLTGTEIGIDLVNAAHSITIDSNWIRDFNNVADTSIGVRVGGNSTGVRIVNNNIEGMPGGNIVVTSTSQLSIAHNYFENFSAAGYDVDIQGGSGITLDSNYHQANTTPSNYSVHVAAGTSSIVICNSTFVSAAIAAIKNDLTNTGVTVYGNNSNAPAFLSSDVGVNFNIGSQPPTSAFQILQDAGTVNPLALIRNLNANGFGLKIRNGNDSNFALRIVNAADNTNAIQLFGNGTGAFGGQLTQNTGLNVTSTIGSGTVTTAGTIINAGTSQAQTGITVTGATATDTATCALNAAPPATWQTGIVTLPPVVTTNTVTVWLSNPTAGNITPAAVIVRCTVTR